MARSKVNKRIDEFIEEKIKTEKLEDIVGERFGAYSKYIIQDRAIPDARDGLKPVQRRILYAMHKLGVTHDKPYKKSARIVGEVMGKYHPHGDSSIYEAMVRLSQDFKTNIKLIDMHGNNGSIDGDPAAAMRYTETRLTLASEYLLEDIQKDTVMFIPNFDDEEYEPVVLPCKFPNLLVNGSTGISSGYATDIPPHNINEVIDAVIYKIDNPHANVEELMDYIKGPDFPTGGIVQGVDGLTQAYKTGKGKIIITSKTEIKDNTIYIYEIPYETNKASIVKKIDEIRISKKVQGIVEVRDESDRTGLQIAIELKKDANHETILNYILKQTELQKSYNFNMVAIDNKRPVLMSLPRILSSFINHQKDVLTNRSNFELEKAKTRQHIVEGLVKMVDVLDEVIKIIRSSKNKSDSKENLIKTFKFSELQAEAIVTLQLYRLSNTDVLALEAELNDLENRIDYLQTILSDQYFLLELIKKELRKTKEGLKKERLTVIESEVSELIIDHKELIQKENCVVSITKEGYIKRSTFRSYQASSGKDMGMKEGDYQLTVSNTNTLSTLLCFTNKGNYIYYPTHLIPDSKWKDIGIHVSNLVPIDSDEYIIYANTVDSFDLDLYLLVCTDKAKIKIIKLNDLQVTRFNKKTKYINLKKDEYVASVSLDKLKESILLTTRQSAYIKYSVSEVPILNTNSSGVNAMNLKGRNDDEIISANFVDETNDLVIMTTRGNIIRKDIAEIDTKKRINKPEIMFKMIKSNPHIILKTCITSKDEYKNSLNLHIITDKVNLLPLFEIKYYSQSEFGKNFYSENNLKDFIKLTTEFNKEYLETPGFDISKEVNEIENSINDLSIFEDTPVDNQENTTNKKIKNIFDIIDEDPDLDI